MTGSGPTRDEVQVAPGDAPETQGEPSISAYVIGLVLASGLTVLSFYITRGTLFWQPSIPTALIVLAIAQMGVHLVFFLHITSGPDSTNNVLALAFGILIVFLIIAGSLWIMANLNHNMLPMDQIMKMQR
jgi:cytochrome o ubiquinol oxidase operon protein cyoD